MRGILIAGRRRSSSWAAEVGVNCRLHDVRHYHGTELADAGIPLTAVRDRLGHTSLVTTSIYVHVRRGAALARSGTLFGVGIPAIPSASCRGHRGYVGCWVGVAPPSSGGEATLRGSSGAIGMGGDDGELVGGTRRAAQAVGERGRPHAARGSGGRSRARGRGRGPSHLELGRAVPPGDARGRSHGLHAGHRPRNV